MFWMSFFNKLVFGSSAFQLSQIITSPVDSIHIDENHVAVRRTIDSSEAFAQRPGNESSWVSYHPAIEGHAATVAYNFDCNTVGEVCSNICYYIWCKGAGNAGYTQTKQAGRIVAPACRGTNRCSVRYTGPEGAFPQTGYQCDEYPMASTTQGGTAGAATRCVPQRQNGQAGGAWGSVPNGQSRTTNLLNVNGAPHYCEVKTVESAIVTLPVTGLPDRSEGILHL